MISKGILITNSPSWEEFGPDDNNRHPPPDNPLPLSVLCLPASVPLSISNASSFFLCLSLPPPSFSPPLTSISLPLSLSLSLPLPHTPPPLPHHQPLSLSLSFSSHSLSPPLTLSLLLSLYLSLSLFPLPLPLSVFPLSPL